MKVIVTGGAGYIGSHTILELLKAKFSPIIIDNLCNTDISNLNGIKYITGQDVKWYNVDCSSKQELETVFKQERNIFGVIHFAAYKSIEESIREPEKYYKNNISSLEVLLDQMKRYNVNNLIFSSSCTVYGVPEILPITEDSIFNKAESPYAETKQVCENILQKSVINSISLRYFNPIGCHYSGLIGDCSSDKKTNLIPIICEVAKGLREKLIINGNDYNTLDGTCIRDYIHVLDLARSHVNALNYLLEKSRKDIFNIGTGEGLSVLQAINCFEKVNKQKINYSFGPRRSGDIEEIYAENQKAKDLLNWEAEISIADAMLDAWNWELKKTE